MPAPSPVMSDGSAVFPKAPGQPLRSYLSDWSKFLGHKPAAGLGASYDVAWPTLPGAKTTMRMDTDGSIVFENEGGGGGPWTDGTGIIYPTDAADDLAVGGTTVSGSPFGVDVSEGEVIGGLPSSGFKFTSRATTGTGFTLNSPVTSMCELQFSGTRYLKFFAETSNTATVIKGNASNPYKISFYGGTYLMMGRHGAGAESSPSSYTSWLEMHSTGSSIWYATEGANRQAGVGTGLLLVVDGRTSHGYGDSGFSKSASDGGNFVETYDGTETRRDDGTRRSYLASRRPGLDSVMGTRWTEFVGCAATQSAVGSALANSAAETSLLGTALGTRTIPANRMRAGSRYRIRVACIISTIAAAQGTLRLKGYFGATAVFDTTAKTPQASFANDLLIITFDVICTATGASGSVRASGKAEFPNAALLADSVWAQTIGLSSGITIDTTATQAIDVKAQWGTADAGNSLQCIDSSIEEIN